MLYNLYIGLMTFQGYFDTFVAVFVARMWQYTGKTILPVRRNNSVQERKGKKGQNYRQNSNI